MESSNINMLYPRNISFPITTFDGVVDAYHSIHNSRFAFFRQPKMETSGNDAFEAPRWINAPGTYDQDIFILDTPTRPHRNYAPSHPSQPYVVPMQYAQPLVKTASPPRNLVRNVGPGEGVRLGYGDVSGAHFVRIPHPSARDRIGRACDKCRTRKTKCTGEKPVCQRCADRGIPCVYGEQKVRGPSKPKVKQAVQEAETTLVTESTALAPPVATHLAPSVAPPPATPVVAPQCQLPPHLITFDPYLKAQLAEQTRLSRVQSETKTGHPSQQAVPITARLALPGNVNSVPQQTMSLPSAQPVFAVPQHSIPTAPAQLFENVSSEESLFSPPTLSSPTFDMNVDVEMASPPLDNVNGMMEVLQAYGFNINPEDGSILSNDDELSIPVSQPAVEADDLLSVLMGCAQSDADQAVEFDLAAFEQAMTDFCSLPELGSTTDGSSSFILSSEDQSPPVTPPELEEDDWLLAALTKDSQPNAPWTPLSESSEFNLTAYEQAMANACSATRWDFSSPSSSSDSSPSTSLPTTPEPVQIVPLGKSKSQTKADIIRAASNPDRLPMTHDEVMKFLDVMFDSEDDSFDVEPAIMSPSMMFNSGDARFKEFGF